MDKNANEQPSFFSTAEEAAGKGKNDLLAALRQGVNLGFNRLTIENSQPGTPVKHYQITFDKLIAGGPNGTFSNLRQNEMATVVPLVADSEIVTTVDVAKGEKGWRVASLADGDIAEDLNLLEQVVGYGSKSKITIYNLPHSAMKVYGVEKDGVEVFHTSYPGFDITERVSAEPLLQALIRDAVELQSKYGEALKENKLVD